MVFEFQNWLFLVQFQFLEYSNIIIYYKSKTQHFIVVCDMNEIYYNYDLENVIGNAYYIIIRLKRGKTFFFLNILSCFFVHRLILIIKFRSDMNGVILRYRQICSGRWYKLSEGYSRIISIHGFRRINKKYYS